jgi:hypothetical protein
MRSRFLRLNPEASLEDRNAVYISVTKRKKPLHFRFSAFLHPAFLHFRIPCIPAFLHSLHSRISAFPRIPAFLHFCIAAFLYFSKSETSRRNHDIGVFV